MRQVPPVVWGTFLALLPGFAFGGWLLYRAERIEAQWQAWHADIGASHDCEFKTDRAGCPKESK